MSREESELTFLRFKMKPILPVLKEKKRYITFEIVTNGNLNKQKTKEEIEKACLKFLGELGVAKAGLMFISFNKVKGILKVNNKYVDEVKTALSLIKEVDNKNVIVNCIGVSGILKKTKQKYLEVV